MVKKTIERRVIGDPDEVLRRCEQALMAIGAGVTSRDARTGMLTAIKGVSWTSWGEKLTVRVLAKDGRESIVRATSESTFRLTVADWGKNRANLDRFIHALDHADSG